MFESQGLTRSTLTNDIPIGDESHLLSRARGRVRTRQCGLPYMNVTWGNTLHDLYSKEGFSNPLGGVVWSRVRVKKRDDLG